MRRRNVLTPVYVNITGEMELEARKYQQAVENTDTLKNTKNYTWFCAKDRYYTGYMGELCFEALLKYAKKWYVHNTRTDGKADNGDFVVMATSGKQMKVTIDVKTTSSPNMRWFLLSVAQANKHPYDIYVGVQLLWLRAAIWGYCRRKELILMEDGYRHNGRPTLCMQYRDMGDIQVVLDNLQDA